ncbi:hypothetical protein HK101_001480 [Irineochytrium annulatum]|nr:hypothetical protein HK101_001480 [Irineochytrium annulatum]
MIHRALHRRLAAAVAVTARPALSVPLRPSQAWSLAPRRWNQTASPGSAKEEDYPATPSGTAIAPESNLHLSELSHEDIITRIIRDHRELQTYHDQYKQCRAEGSSEADMWFNQYLWKLSRHSVGEEIVFYPLLESIDPLGRTMADTCRRDHRDLKELLSALQRIRDPALFERRLDFIMNRLMDHMKEEEAHELPYLHSHMNAEGRESAGYRFAFTKDVGPTRPHPEVPERIVALEAAMAIMLAPLDKFRDLFRPFPDTSKVETKDL